MKPIGNQYAYMDDEWAFPEPDPHIRGTIERSGGRLEFWLSRPRPRGIDIDEWEEMEQAKWNRIFGKGEN